MFTSSIEVTKMREDFIQLHFSSIACSISSADPNVKVGSAMD
ncbi:MAG: hypothetical protein AAGE84_06785 [Cyanobacteria bacterium P01_G01_bin.39]